MPFLKKIICLLMGFALFSHVYSSEPLDWFKDKKGKISIKDKFPRLIGYPIGIDAPKEGIPFTREQNDAQNPQNTLIKENSIITAQRANEKFESLLRNMIPEAISNNIIDIDKVNPQSKRKFNAIYQRLSKFTPHTLEIETQRKALETSFQEVTYINKLVIPCITVNLINPPAHVGRTFMYLKDDINMYKALIDYERKKNPVTPQCDNDIINNVHNIDNDSKPCITTVDKEQMIEAFRKELAPVKTAIYVSIALNIMAVLLLFALMAETHALN